MILVDTSVWIDHLRQGDTQLAAALEAAQVRLGEVYPELQILFTLRRELSPERNLAGQAARRHRIGTAET